MKKTKFDIFVSIYSWIVIVIILAIMGHISSNVYTLRKIELEKIEPTVASVLKQVTSAFNSKGEVETIRINAILRSSPQLIYLSAHAEDSVVFTASDESTGIFKYREGSFFGKIFYRQISEQIFDSLGRTISLNFIIRLMNNRDLAGFIENDIIMILSLLIFTIVLSIVLLSTQHSSMLAKRVKSFSFKEKLENTSDDIPIDSNYNPFLYDKEVVNFFAADERISSLEELEHPMDINFDDMSLEGDDEVVSDDFNLDSLEVNDPAIEDFTLDNDEVDIDDDLEFIENLPMLDESEESILNDTFFDADSIDINIPEDEPLNILPDEGETEELIAALLTHHEEISIVCFQNTENDSAFENDAIEFFMQHGNINVEVLTDSFLLALTGYNEQKKVKIMKQFTEQMKRSGHNVSCGITSTHGRKIKAHLLLREACAALKEATLREDNKIILFKPNIEAYTNIFYV